MSNKEEILKRVKLITKYKNLKDLSRITGIKYDGLQRGIKRENGIFQGSWAIIIGQKFNKCPNWIMTGECCPGEKKDRE